MLLHLLPLEHFITDCLLQVLDTAFSPLSFLAFLLQFILSFVDSVNLTLQLTSQLDLFKLAFLFQTLNVLFELLYRLLLIGWLQVLKVFELRIIFSDSFYGLL